MLSRMTPQTIAALVALAAALPVWAAGPPDPKDLVKAELVAETASAAPATSLWVDLHLQIKPGWHVYWRNPGDSGLATAIDWHLPPGFSAGDILWPVPEHFVQNDIGNYGYAGTADLLVPITVPKDIAGGGTAKLMADASWLACAEICIPGGAELSLSLPVTATPVALDPAAAKRFAAIRDRLPPPAPFETRFASTSDEYRLLVPAIALAGLHNPTAVFFPYDGSLIDHAAEPRLSDRAGGLEIGLKKAVAAPHGPPPNLAGVLLLHGRDGGEHAYEIAAEPAPVPPADNGIGIGWWEALLLAFFGGVILNAMPCVFPILSLKLLSLALQAHGHPKVKLGHGLAYTAGVLASFAALGGALLALRAGGQAIGWGFQLQTPVFVAVVAYLLFAMGLSLSGVLAFGAGLAGTGGRLADRAGLTGTFFTGVLATIVATPCTAPFMGTATGFALVAPGPVAIGIFLALGLGLAAPYLAATVMPGWQRVLPRPGPWMVMVKQILAFPIYGTVAWLLWVLIQQVGPGQSLAALFGLVLVGFAAWIYGRTRFSAPQGRRLGAGLAVAGFAGALMLAGSFATTGAGTTAAAQDRLAYEPFTAARFAALEAAGKPVFVNLTADWCVTCLINERVALDSDGVRQAFAARGIVALKGDWTNRNPEITALLQQYGRSGVPLYLLYGGKGKPVILPQILTAATVLDALGKV
jgi:thiol:disulfide interchange protein/DsbC/DsbD-like thiol-disulfide interchange protein